MKRLSLLLFCLPLFLSAQNQAPEISNVEGFFNFFDNQLTVTFDVFDQEGDSIELRFFLSDDQGESYQVDVSSATGDLGFPHVSGSKTITWQAPGGINYLAHRIKIVAWDRHPMDIQAMVDQVDSTRLRQNLEFIAQERTSFTALPHLEAVKDTIETLFSGFGLQASRQSKPLAGGYVMENILGRKPGLFHPDKTYIVDAHFDGVAGTAAADDNGSGTVGFLEVARILSQYEFANSLQFMGFDQEEAGLLGSIEYVLNGIQPWESIEGVLNFEMIGYYDSAPNTQQLPPGFNLLFPQLYNEIAADSFRGNFLINVANVASNPLRATFDSCAAAYVPELIVRSVAAPGNSELAPDLRRSDHAPFWDNGNQALMITDGADFRNPHYHSPADSIGTLDFTFMHQVVKAVLATAATLAKPLHADVSITEMDGGVIDAIPPMMESCGLRYQQSGTDLRFSLEQPGCRRGDWQLELYNLQGQLIHQQVWSRTTFRLSLESHQLNPGVYLWQLTGEGESFGKKILLH